VPSEKKKPTPRQFSMEPKGSLSGSCSRWKLQKTLAGEWEKWYPVQLCKVCSAHSYGKYRWGIKFSHILKRYKK